MKSINQRAVVYSLVILMGLLSALPNLLPDKLLQQFPAWYAQNTFTLGLDLRGGSHLLLEINANELLLDNNRQLADQLSADLREARIYHERPQASREAISIRLQNPEQLEQVLQKLREVTTRETGDRLSHNIEVQNGRVLITPEKNYIQALKRDAVERSLEVVRRRLDESGLVDPTITRQGEDAVLVQLPGVDNPQYIRQLLGTTAKMTFHWAPNAQSQSFGAIVTLPGQYPGESYRLEQRVALEGKHIRDAQLGYDPQSGEPLVNFKLDREGAGRFGEMTRENIGRQLAIVLDNKVITAPVIRGEIPSGSGQISGSFTAAEASDLALLLRAGALPAPLQVIEERTVGPDLGSDAIAMGLATGIAGVALVFAFMIALYGRWGLIACSALALNIGLVFGILSALGATLTLPGIAGLILSFGMAVDANILINERIREETRQGQKAWNALDAGFRRAFGTIVDSNITSLIAISLLFLFGSGPVRGFAVAMAIGLLVSMFTSITVTRLLMEHQVRRLGREPLQISGFALVDKFGERTINFMRSRFAGLAISAVLSIASLILFFQPGLNYGIDFSGGSVVEVQDANISVNELRSGLHAQQITDIYIQEFGDHNGYLLRLPNQNATQVASGENVQALKSAVLELAPDAKFPRVESVGPRVSGQFADATVLAILLAGAGMLAYLWIRFEAHFATAAMLTLALDLTKTIGFFALTGVEFNLTAVAALLALIGYSVNDKVVVFDRIRENLQLTPDKPLAQVFNESITATLTRTIFTSATTLLAILPMALAGGSAVASFALPMLFGIVVGTSSSILIAAPIVLLLGERRFRKGLTQLRPTREKLQEELDRIP